MSVPSRYGSVKIARQRYRVSCPKRRMQVSVQLCLGIVQHKGRWVVAFLEDVWKREFESCNTINRTQALRMIEFLSDYVNLVKPTDATVLNASIKARANSITRDSAALTGLAVCNMEHAGE